MKNITIVGGGPAALMLASHLDTTNYNVTIYDQKKSVGRKFLVAG
ncbi:MAG: NAD(P)/FAD-dependent oxidoreductase, partial [Bacteroidia bacterium]